MVSSCFRRRFLLSSVGAAAALSGCSSLGSSENTAKPFRLGSIEIRNLSPTSHRVHIFVERDSDVIYWNEISVHGKQDNTAGGEVIAPDSLVRSEGDCVIHARLDEQMDPETFDSSVEDLTGCHVVLIRIESDGEVVFATSKDAYECSPD